ncbi:MAG TPA: DUF924 family protein [Usitatibacter sp.]|nr:DUF924 family protein [Usitatibacter sp.]
MSRPTQPTEVLDFWFGAPRGTQRPEWFRKDDRFDEEIRRRFGEVHHAAARGALDHWRQDRESMLALIVVLDQFSRNLYRNDPRAFAQDARARECTREALARGDDAVSLPVERQFLYLPLEHSEDRDDQVLACSLFARLEEQSAMKGLMEYAVRHKAIVDRFGRFPHRNSILGRASTPEEIEFLKTPGSGF